VPVVTKARTLPIEFVRGAAALAERHGWDVNAILTEAGVSPALLDEGRSRVTDDQLVTVAQALWRETDDEVFGLGKHPLPRGSFRLLCYGIVNAVDLDDALGRFEGFLRAMPGLPVTIERGPEVTTIGLPPGHGDSHQLMGLVGLASAQKLLAWAIRQEVPLVRVELTMPAPSYADELATVFGVPPAFGAPASQIAFSSTLLTAPLMRDEADIEEFIATSPRQLFEQSLGDPGLAERVRRILEVALKSGEWPTAEQVAGRLAMSAQTLRRGLAKDGTSLRQLNEQVRRDAAVTSLVNGEEKIGDLSVRLGFSEPSAFVRAFRRWTGSTPAAYRRDGLEPT